MGCVGKELLLYQHHKGSNCAPFWGGGGWTKLAVLALSFSPPFCRRCPNSDITFGFLKTLVVEEGDVL